MPTDLSMLPTSSRSGADSPHASPTIAGLPEKAMPDPSPACLDCPRSDWLVVAAKGLKCYCTAFHRITWEMPLGEWGAVMACDARELAIQALIAPKTE